MHDAITEIERTLLELMADTNQRRWWNYAALQELLPDHTRNQIVGAMSALRRRDLVTPNHRSLGQSDFTITTAGELLLRGELARGGQGWSNR